MSHALAIIPTDDRDDTHVAEDPILAAIARHRAAAVDFENAAIALERVTTHPANQRTPMTIAAMARADIARDAAGIEEQTAWEAIWGLEPQTFGALMVASRYASDALDGWDRDAPDAATVFGLIAKHLQRLIGTLPEGTPENQPPASIEYMAAIDFEPHPADLLDALPTAETWQAAADQHLPIIRTAGAFLVKDRAGLHRAVAEIGNLEDGGVAERLSRSLSATTAWLAGMHEIVDSAQTRFLAAASAAALREKAGKVQTVDDRVDAEPAPPRGYVPGVEGAHPESYGLAIEAGGAGLRAPPGSVLIVEPVPPTPNGLAVVYFKRGGTPRVFDLDRRFDPADLLYHPDSTVFPLIEMIEPISGQYGRIDVRKIEKMHRVCGVYQPAEVAERCGPDVPVLPEFTRCWGDMIEHRVESAAAYPILREGEVAIVDPSRRAVRHGGLYLIEWNNGTRSVLTTNQRNTGGVEGAWWVDPVNRPRTRELLEMRLAAGAGLLFSSDGPYTLEHLQEKIVGEAIGVLVPGAPDDGERQPPGGDSLNPTDVPNRADNLGFVPFVPTDVPHPGECPIDLAGACAWVVKHRAWADGLNGPQSDEDSAAEMAIDDAIFARAIATPAATTRDLWGKARLAFEDLYRFHIENHEAVDDGILLVQATLRDAIRLTETTERIGPSLRLTAMVAEWKALVTRINSDEIGDDDLDPITDQHNALQMAIYAFPAASVADLLVKVPVLQDEMRDAVRGAADDTQPAETLAGAAWLGLFRDFERLASGVHPTSFGVAA